MQDTEPLLKETDFPPIVRGKLEVLQVNLGYLCNQSCSHCHVNAGPTRTELASLDTIKEILSFAEHNNITCLDITGGAPEMNPHFRYLVMEARAQQIEVIDRCNLTILNQPDYHDLAEFLASHGVTVIASLPCYSLENVDQQRGKGVFDSSIKALKKLNVFGYGQSGNNKLHLVYNPNGAFLPPNQKALEQSYKDVLQREFDIHFNELLTITNMPISRFGATLLAKKQYKAYISLLKDNYSESNLTQLMCLNLLSVDWQGYVYDCDFNQMLNWPLRYDLNAENNIASDKTRLHLSELKHRNLDKNPIMVGEHCYGCTAGQGSSCGGALEP